MRGKKAPKRKRMPDPKFGSIEIGRLINLIMQNGKKSVAERIVYMALDEIGKRSEKDPQKVFTEAIKKVSPTLEIRSRRVGGANYQIPFPVNDTRKLTLAFRWLIAAARSRKGKPMHEKLAMEVLDAAKGEGTAMKKRMDMQRMAEANKAFAHFARYG